jgi:hypothetical protein
VSSKRGASVRLGPADFEAGLPGSPAPPPAGDVGAGLLNGEQRFFEARSLAAQELPHRIVRDLDPAVGQLGFQAMKRQMRRLAEPLHDESAARLEKRPFWRTFT